MAVEMIALRSFPLSQGKSAGVSRLVEGVPFTVASEKHADQLEEAGKAKRATPRKEAPKGKGE